MSKLASHWPFGHRQPKLWAKEGPGVKLAIWLPTTKSRESTSSRRPTTVCDMALESPRGELQHWFRPCSNRTWKLGDMSSQSPGTPIGTVSGLQLESPRKKSHLDVASAESCREYYKGEGGGFPWVWAVMSQVSPSRPWLVPTPKGCRMSFNQLVVGFGCRIV
jgi:hypothetical protein